MHNQHMAQPTDSNTQAARVHRLRVQVEICRSCKVDASRLFLLVEISLVSKRRTLCTAATTTASANASVDEHFLDVAAALES